MKKIYFIPKPGDRFWAVSKKELKRHFAGIMTCTGTNQTHIKGLDVEGDDVWSFIKTDWVFEKVKGK